MLHTADWHLSDRLRQIDRTPDLQRAVERVARHCDEHAVDVLLVAGDLFSELARPEALQLALAHLSQALRPFLLRGGTVVAIAGNHDNDIYCETLRRAFQLAAPNLARPGDVLPRGRFYMITTPAHFRLRDPGGEQVQFACLPYPTTGRYLRELSAGSYASFDQRRQLLQSAFIDRLRHIRSQLDPHQPRVLVAHVNALANRPHGLFSGQLDADVVVDHPLLTSGWTYVALGHLHGPGPVGGSPHVRYSGSIERLSISEKDQQKGVVLVELGGQPSPVRVEFLPLPATTFYDICIVRPHEDLPLLAARYPEAATALTRCHVRFRPERDNLHDILAEIARVFPRCYERTWSEQHASRVGSPAMIHMPCHAIMGEIHASARDEEREVSRPELMFAGDASWRQFVLHYLGEQLAGDADRDALMALAEQLMEESD